MEIPYDPNFPFYFNNHFNFIEKYLPHLIGQNGYYEKRKIKWMTIQEIIRKQSHFRQFYQAIITPINRSRGTFVIYNTIEKIINLSIKFKYKSKAD